MLAAGFLFTLVTGPTAFGLSRTDLPELRLDGRRRRSSRPSPCPRAATSSSSTPAPLEAALEALPGVAAADVSVALPDGAVVVGITERTAILAWEVGNHRYIADASGTIFAEVNGDADAARRRRGRPTTSARRPWARSRSAATSTAIDLDVATRLGSVDTGRHRQHGGAAAGGRHRLDGYVLATRPRLGCRVRVLQPGDPADGDDPRAGPPAAAASSRVARRRSGAIILASETTGTYVPRSTP